VSDGELKSAVPGVEQLGEWICFIEQINETKTGRGKEKGKRNGSKIGIWEREKNVEINFSKQEQIGLLLTSSVAE
jgi:hypothetical protein